MARIDPLTVRLAYGTEVVIRTTEESDAVALLSLDQNVVSTQPFNVRLPEERTNTEDKEREWIREHLNEPGALAILAQLIDHAGEPGQVVGGLAFKAFKFLRMRHHGHFGIGVHSDWRGRGIGTHLLRTLIGWAREHEFIERIDLGVFADNTGARALYARLGFREVCVREREFRYGPGEYMDDVQMSLWVKGPASPSGLGSDGNQAG